MSTILGMSDLVSVLLEVPILPPGHDVQIGGHFVELLGIAVGLPLLIGGFLFIIGAGPTLLRRAQQRSTDIEPAN